MCNVAWHVTRGMTDVPPCDAGGSGTVNPQVSSRSSRWLSCPDDTQEVDGCAHKARLSEFFDISETNARERISAVCFSCRKKSPVLTTTSLTPGYTHTHLYIRNLGLLYTLQYALKVLPSPAAVHSSVCFSPTQRYNHNSPKIILKNKKLIIINIFSKSNSETFHCYIPSFKNHIKFLVVYDERTQ